MIQYIDMRSIHSSNVEFIDMHTSMIDWKLKRNGRSAISIKSEPTSKKYYSIESKIKSEKKWRRDRKKTQKERQMWIQICGRLLARI